jgi:hypothetical protein
MIERSEGTERAGGRIERAGGRIERAGVSPGARESK